MVIVQIAVMRQVVIKMIKCKKCGLMIIRYYDDEIGFEKVVDGKRKMLKDYPLCNNEPHKFNKIRFRKQGIRCEYMDDNLNDDCENEAMKKTFDGFYLCKEHYYKFLKEAGLLK